MKHTDIINSLDLEQKCALLSGGTVFTTRALPGKGIPAITLSDGPNGVRKQAGAADHLGLNPSVPATCFPTSATVANSWDPELGEAVGAAMGEEAAAQGVSVLLGPGLNIKRSPLCGRNFEYFSEDPYLAGKMAAAYVRGIQKNGIAACPKHFAVNSQELRRMASDSIVDERTLREIYLTGFEMVVKEAQPKTIMSAYNLVNGTYANENAHLLMDILRRDWGFDGAVVTDWGGSNDHALGVKNGSTLEMPFPGDDSVRELMKAVESGKISEADVDARLDELLELVLDTKAAVEKAPRTFDAAAHHALARRAAAESAVLLKNDGVLPLDTSKKIAFVGPYTNNHEIKSSWSFTGDSKDCVTIQKAAEKVFDASRTTYAEGCPVIGNDVELIGFTETTPKKYSEEELAAMEQSALQAAKEADLVVMPMGEHYLQSGEATSRAMIDVPEIQMELFHKVLAVNPNVVVVLFNGRPLDLREISAKAKAILEVWFPGTEGGSAVVDVLTGKKNPSGKLPMSFPYCVGQAPVSYNEYSTGRPNLPGMKERFRSKYLDIPNAPLYPFGYGLSYTTFAVSDVVLDQNEMDKNGRIAAKVTVKNTGDAAGCEVVQLYIRDDYSDVVRPVKELKGFRKVELAPGEEQEVTFYITEEDLRYYRLDGTFGSEPGTFTVMIGNSSTTENSAVFTLTPVDKKSPASKAERNRYPPLT